MAKVTRAIALTLMLLSATAQRAAAEPQRPYPVKMTGDQLVRDMLADPNDDKFNSVRRERAMGYIDGVLDSTIGMRWCPAGQPVPHELNYVVAEDIARMPAAKLKSSAAALVIATLARHYPCKSTGAKP